MPGYQPGLCDCWAKTFSTGPFAGFPALTVRDHCLNVGAVSLELLPLLARPVQSLLPDGCALLVAAHDIGKITPGFLWKCAHWQFPEARPAASGETDHARVSQWFLSSLAAFQRAGGRPTDWLLAAGGHHGRYPSPSASKLARCREFSESGWPEVLRGELWAELVALFGSPPGELLFLSSGGAQAAARVHLLTGFTTFCDWIGSDESVFPLDAANAGTHNATLPGSRAAARTALESIGTHRRAVLPDLDFAALFAAPASPAFSPRPLQSALVALMEAPGLYIVEAPMGMGKTEAALAGAYARWSSPDSERGLYFALPTQLTSQRIHRRIASFLENVIADPATLALVHGNSWLSDERLLQLSPTAAQDEASPENGGAAEAHGWFASTTRRALLAPFGTGTIDQALLSVLPAKHAALRFFALAGKVIVFDEVHSYDPYTSALVDRAIQWLHHAGCTVLVLSATLTAARRAALVAAAGASEPPAPDAYPLITRVATGSGIAAHHIIDDGAPRESSVALEHHSAADAGLWSRAVQAAEAGACVLIIRNTVALAQETYRQVKSSCCGESFEVGLLHSRFPQWQRDAQEDHWTTRLGKNQALRPRGCVLVATQVVEQSVDIDADLLITDLAPTDLLFQRMGRLHRHDRPRPAGFAAPRCLILHPPVDLSGDAVEIRKALSPHSFVYPPYSLCRAHALWSQRTCITLPRDIRPVLEQTYAEESGLPAGVAELREQLAARVARMIGTAESRSVFASPSTADKEGADTRWIEQETTLVVLLAAAPEVRGSRVTITLHHGSLLSADAARFHMGLARALHRHAVRVPRYLVAPALAHQPAWFRAHLDDAVLAIRTPGTTACLIPDAPAGTATLHYHPEHGLTHTRPAATAAAFSPEEDDGWY